MTDFDKWQIAEARCADLQARCDRLENAAADMRERAAKVCDLAAETCPDKGSIQQLAQKASAAFIRALPTEKAAPAGEG